MSFLALDFSSPVLILCWLIFVPHRVHILCLLIFVHLLLILFLLIFVHPILILYLLMFTHHPVQILCLLIFVPHTCNYSRLPHLCSSLLAHRSPSSLPTPFPLLPRSLSLLSCAYSLLPHLCSSHFSHFTLHSFPSLPLSLLSSSIHLSNHRPSLWPSHQSHL